VTGLTPNGSRRLDRGSPRLWRAMCDSFLHLSTSDNLVVEPTLVSNSRGRSLIRQDSNGIRFSTFSRILENHTDADAFDFRYKWKLEYQDYNVFLTGR
jgi:hypothetical protein